PRLMGDRQVAGYIVDVDGIFGGKGQKMRLGLFRKVEQSLGAGEIKLSFEVLAPGALAGAKLPAIAARRAVAQPMGFDKDHVCAASCQMDSSGQAGEAPADDHDVGAGAAIKRRIFGSGGQGRLVE